MKVFVAFALLIVATNAAKSLCNKEGADLDAAAELKANIEAGSMALFGSCDAFSTDLFLSGSCNVLLEEGFCYSQLARAHYGDADPVSYGHLADDVLNIAFLGKTACNHARTCFDDLKAVFLECDAKDDIDFRQDVIVAAEAMFRESGETIIIRWTQHSNSLLSELAALARSTFTSVEDIAQVIDQFVSDEMVSDAKRGFEEFSEAAEEWCVAKCEKKSGKFFKRLFNYMNGGAGCVDASEYCEDCADRADEYCGECKARADDHLASNPIPCCLDNAIQKGIAAVEYVRDNYAEEIEEVRSYLSEELSPDAQALAEKYRARISKQIDCLSDSYSKNRPECA